MINSDYEELRLRVGYLDYCGKDDNGYRINIPCNVGFNNISYTAVDISEFIPNGYQIDPEFPTIQATMNAKNVAAVLRCVSRYHSTAILFELNQNHTGTINFAVGVRLRKVS